MANVDKSRYSKRDPAPTPLRSRPVTSIPAPGTVPRLSKNYTFRRRLFLEAYLADPFRNAGRAAKKAGYLDGSGLVNDPYIQLAVQEADAKAAKKFEITSEAVLQEIAGMAYSNLFDYLDKDESGEFVVDLSKVTRQQASAIQDFSSDNYNGNQKIRIKLADKNAALMTLGRCLKMFENGSNNSSTTVTINLLDQILLGKVSGNDLQKAISSSGQTQRIIEAVAVKE